MQSVSAFAVDLRLYHPLKKNAIQHSVSTNAGRKRNVSVACSQLQLDGHWQYSHLCFFYYLSLALTPNSPPPPCPPSLPYLAYPFAYVWNLAETIKEKSNWSYVRLLYLQKFVNNINIIIYLLLSSGKN